MTSSKYLKFSSIGESKREFGNSKREMIISNDIALSGTKEKVSGRSQATKKFWVLNCSWNDGIANEIKGTC